MATVNDLLEAIRAAKPSPPGPEWMTRKEIAAALEMSYDMVERRMRGLQAEGKVEMLRAPRRDIGNGLAVYYRFKKEQA